LQQQRVVFFVHKNVCLKRQQCSRVLTDMADWNFAVLDDEYNHLNGGPWAGLNGFANAEDLEDVGAHW
jgi:hypothetical protein